MYKELSYTNLALNGSLVIDCSNVVVVAWGTGVAELDTSGHLAPCHLVVM